MGHPGHTFTIALVGPRFRGSKHSPKHASKPFRSWNHENRNHLASLEGDESAPAEDTSTTSRIENMEGRS